MTIGISGQEAQVIGDVARPPAHFSSVWTAAIGRGAVAVSRHFTAASVQVIGTQPVAVQQFTQFFLQFLATRAPSTEWLPMILQDVFPNDISYNSVGSIRFATDVTVVDSGDDQRTGRWDQPLQEFDISYGVRTMEQLQQLIAFFRAMRGRLYAFNFRDHLDYASSMASAVEARAAPPPTSQDQLQLRGDGVTYRFQLCKHYVAPLSGTTQTRPITRPEPDTVEVFWTGEGNGDWATHFLVDHETGIVTLLPRYGVTAHMTKAAGSGRLVATPGTFSIYRHAWFLHRRVQVTGFGNVENNVTVSQMATIESIADDDSWIELAYAQGGAAADEGDVTVKIHPAPPIGVDVYAGFQFFVPVRFDTDTLSTTLEDYGVGSANSIKLVEVRPQAF